jgi:hypothetical protein
LRDVDEEEVQKLANSLREIRRRSFRAQGSPGGIAPLSLQ